MDNIRAETNKFAPFQNGPVKENKTLVIIGKFALLAAVQAGAGTEIKADIAVRAMNMLDVDAGGLDEGDRKILRAIIELFGGGPVGLGTLAAALNEDSQTIEDIYEPYLIQKGLIERTPRGRKATQNAYSYLGIAHNIPF